MMQMLGEIQDMCFSTMTLQVSDRACDEGVRVMDKGVEKAGAVLDKGASIKLQLFLFQTFGTFPKQSAFTQSLPSRFPINLQVAEGSRSRNPFQLQFVPAFNN